MNAVVCTSVQIAVLLAFKNLPSCLICCGALDGAGLVFAQQAGANASLETDTELLLRLDKAAVDPLHPPLDDVRSRTCQNSAFNLSSSSSGSSFDEDEDKDVKPAMSTSLASVTLDKIINEAITLISAHG